MRKFLAFILPIFILLSFPAYAESSNNIQKIQTCIPWNIKENLYKELDSYKSLKVSKEEISIESYLKKHYAIYLYQVKNISSSNIEIVSIHNIYDADKVIEQIESQRLRFPNVYSTIPVAIKKSKDYLLLAPFTFLFELPQCNSGLILLYPLTSGVIGIYYLAIDLPLAITKSAYYTVMAPYYKVADKKSYTLAKKETAYLKNTIAGTQISPNKEIQFYVLMDKYYNKEKKPELFLIYKGKDGDKNYLIEH